MDILTFSEARASLKQVMDDVCMDHQPKVITRQRGDHVVLISHQDYNSLIETLHLLNSPNNAYRLKESINQVKAGSVTVRELLYGNQKEQK